MKKNHEGFIMYYLRFGKIPEDEKSSIHYRGYYCGKEEGVSVYHCAIINHKPHIILPIPYSEGAMDTLYGLLFYDKDKPVYIVTGKRIGTGHDGEPLIRDVKIIKDITKDFRSNAGIMVQSKEDAEALHEKLLKLAEVNDPNFSKTGNDTAEETLVLNE